MIDFKLFNEEYVIFFNNLVNTFNIILNIHPVFNTTNISTILFPVEVFRNYILTINKDKMEITENDYKKMIIEMYSSDNEFLRLYIKTIYKNILGKLIILK